jgi:hypothetical protein
MKVVQGLEPGHSSVASGLWASFSTAHKAVVKRAFEYLDINRVFNCWLVGARLQVVDIPEAVRHVDVDLRGKVSEGVVDMELDLQSLFGLLCAQMYSMAEIPQLPPLPPHLGSYTRALLVSKDRRHLFVTPWCGRTW